MISKEKKEDAVRRYMTEIWSKGNMDAIDELIDPHFAFILAFARTDTIEGFKRMVNYNRTVFERLTYTAKDTVVDGSKAACWWTMTGKHVGTWRNVPGTNKDVSIEGLTFFWFSPEGKLVKAVVENDVLGLLSQLDAVKLIYES